MTPNMATVSKTTPNAPREEMHQDDDETKMTSTKLRPGQPDEGTAAAPMTTRLGRGRTLGSDRRPGG
jgi:hypothetical protein